MKYSFQTLVVGSGPAGIAAAVSAAEHGMGVGLVDDNPSAGGQIWRESLVKSNSSQHGNAERWRKRLLDARVTLLQGCSVFDQSHETILRAEMNGRVTNLEFEKLVIATGARERFLPFPGWTLRNVMGVGAIQAMVKSGLPVRNKRIVIAGSGPLLLAVSAYLQKAGAKVVCVCEQASISQLLPFACSLVSSPSKIVEGIRYKVVTLGSRFYTSAWPLEAEGEGILQSVTLSIHGKIKRVACDYLACAFHLVPNIEFASLLGCSIVAGAVKVDDFQQTSLQTVYCAGEPTGIGGLELSLIEGQIAGLTVAGQMKQARALFAQREKFRRFAARLSKAFTLRAELRKLPSEETILCRCEDVRYGSARGHNSWRAAKLQTRCGMGPCQGRICGSAAEFLLGWDANSVRPPIFPALISSLTFSQADDAIAIPKTLDV